MKPTIKIIVVVGFLAAASSVVSHSSDSADTMNEFLELFQRCQSAIEGGLPVDISGLTKVEIETNETECASSVWSHSSEFHLAEFNCSRPEWAEERRFCKVLVPIQSRTPEKVDPVLWNKRYGK